MKANGASASFKVSDAMTLVGYTTKLEDDLAASGEDTQLWCRGSVYNCFWIICCN